MNLQGIASVRKVQFENLFECPCPTCRFLLVLVYYFAFEGQYRQRFTLFINSTEHTHVTRSLTACCVLIEFHTKKLLLFVYDCTQPGILIFLFI